MPSGRWAENRACCRARACALVALFFLAGFFAHAEEPQAAEAPRLTAQGVQALLDAAAQDAALDPTVKSSISSLYTQALEQVRSSDEWSAKATQFDAEAAAAPDGIRGIQKELRKALPKIDEPQGTTAELGRALAQAESDLVVERQERALLEEEASQRPDRRRQLPESIVSARRRLAALPAQEVPPEAASVLGWFEAGKTLSDGKRQAIESEIRAYETQLVTFEIRGQLNMLRLDRSIRRIGQLDKQAKVLRRAVSERRQEEAQQAVQDAQQALLEATNASPKAREVAGQLAETNAAFAQRRAGPNGLLMLIDGASLERSSVEAELTLFREQAKSVRQKVEAAGLTNAIGLLLRRQKTELPDTKEHRRNVRARRDTVAQVQFEQIELADQRAAMADIDFDVQRMLVKAGVSKSADQGQAIEDLFRELLLSNRDMLDTLYQDYDTYFEELVDLDSAEQRLIEEVDELDAYIEERILWIVSGTVLGFDELRDAGTAAKWLFSGDQWLNICQTLWIDFRMNPVLDVAAILLLAAFYWAWRRAAAWLRAVADQAAKANCLSFRITFESLLLVLLRAAFFPALLWFLGWRLGVVRSNAPFVAEVSAALRGTALVALSLGVLREMIAPFGLAEAHFGWSCASTAALRRHTAQLSFVLVPCAFVVLFVQESANEAWRESLGRLAFLIELAAVAVFAHRLVHPRRGHAQRIRGLTHPGSASRWRYVWYAVGVVAPLLLFLLTWEGYFYTAFRFGMRLYETACLLLALYLARGMVLRWLLVVQRVLARESATVCEEPHPPDAAVSETAREAEQDAEDLARLDAKTFRLVQSFVFVAALLGLWLIWSHELPALGVLKRVELWDNTRVVTEVTVNTEGAQNVQSREIADPITLADLVLAVFIGVMTFLLAADVPGLTDVLLLKRLNVATGERYAIRTLIQYAIVSLGAIVAFRAIGVGWERIQWLVAAIGLGLGFGLQEIFANFVSGLIMLFERPVRVDDMVTVGGVSGRVTRIRMRATVIMALDHKELIVPNKEFITGQLVNWTLSDPLLRLIVPVGIAYGSNTALAEKILYEVALRNPDVLPDPPPVVLFKRFGESSLDFELRVHCANPDVYIGMQHSLHMEIDHAFRDAKIEIAFPQRDLHIRSSIDGMAPNRDSVRDLPAALPEAGKSQKPVDGPSAPSDL